MKTSFNQYYHINDRGEVDEQAEHDFMVDGDNSIDCIMDYGDDEGFVMFYRGVHIVVGGGLREVIAQ